MEEHDKDPFIPLTWQLAPQIAARAIVAWPLSLYPAYLLCLIEESAPGWGNVAFMAMLIAPIIAYIGTAIGTCERDGSQFGPNLLRWSRRLYLGPLLAILWLVGNFPLILPRLVPVVLSALGWITRAALKVTFWGALLIVLPIVALAIGYLIFAGLKVLPVSAAVIIGALIIAAAVSSRRD
mgnify:CR=1 FL=1